MRHACLSAALLGALAASTPAAPAPEQKLEGKEVRRIDWPGNHVFHTGFSPDSRLYFGGGDSGTLRVWDVASGKQLQEFPVTIGFITPDAAHLIGFSGKAILVFSLDSGKEERRWEAAEPVVSLALSGDGKRVATGHADRAIRVWDFATGKEVAKLEGHEAPPSVTLSPDGKQVLSAATDKTVRLWDAVRGKEERKFEGFQGAAALPGTDLIVQASFVAGGRVVGYCWGKERALIVWEAASGKEVKKLDLGADHHKDVAVSADGRWLLSGHENRTVRLRELATGKEVLRFEMPDVNVPRAMSISPNGRYAVAGSHRGKVYLWQLLK
jgi:WD40 repeat protein